MDEMTLLRELRADAPHQPPTAGREKLLRAINRSSTTPRRRRPVAKVLDGAAAAGTLTAGALGLQAGPGAEPSAAAVLDHAARVVAAQPFVAPSRTSGSTRRGTASTS